MAPAGGALGFIAGLATGLPALTAGFAALTAGFAAGAGGACLTPLPTVATLTGARGAVVLVCTGAMFLANTGGLVGVGFLGVAL